MDTPPPNAQPNLGTRLGIGFMRLLARLPLPWVRALGRVLGHVLHALAGRRRRIALANWRACFPDQSEAECRAAVRRHFVFFAQAWLDRGWLWEGPEHLVKRRLMLKGDLAVFDGDKPTVMFAPHFVGLDAGGTALSAKVARRFCSVYAEQANPAIDRWIAEGRQRFGHPHIVNKWQGLRAIVSAVRDGFPLYLLPDMDHGERDAVFVPFFGVKAATVTSLPRLARLGKAQVVSVTTRMVPEGYEVTVHPPWEGYPTESVEEDTARMNRVLEGYIRTMPEQYYWVHKRFKTRPPGEPDFYQGV
ncbi:lipid A biosynthesis acyltransferase [Hydrogenophaga sp.]|uniref:LpxL/LpxP family acyltransferase n=1 Tax=Hydrogenophaga sp. TaxID=1904254 RepID=UPI0025C40820|nr:lipid A biosynthesis acyltransferase [Hydrogenophaga sp.]